MLDFDDFLKMPGCKQGSHLFIGVTKSSDEEELVECRFDYYQTPNSVIVSIFGKGAVKEASIVTFDEQAVSHHFPLAEQQMLISLIDRDGFTRFSFLLARLSYK